jgi:hypothetical protein
VFLKSRKIFKRTRPSWLAKKKYVRPKHRFKKPTTKKYVHTKARFKKPTIKKPVIKRRRKIVHAIPRKKHE